MTDAGYTHIAFLLDRSGSMQSIKTDTEGGFDAYIAAQKAATGRCTVTLAQFDDDYEEVYAARDIAAVPPLDLQPRGMTALHDSIAQLIHSTGAFLSGLPEAQRPGTVLVGIITDGLENASTEWTGATVKKLIEQQEGKYDWTFSYMGANQDAIEVGATIGIAAERSLTYSTGNVAYAMSAYSASATNLRAAVAGGATVHAARRASAYTPAQRVAAAGPADTDANPTATKPKRTRRPR